MYPTRGVMLVMHCQFRYAVLSILRYAGHILKDDGDKLIMEVILEPSIEGEIKIDNNQNLLMKEIDESLFIAIKKRKRNKKTRADCKIYIYR